MRTLLIALIAIVLGPLLILSGPIGQTQSTGPFLQAESPESTGFGVSQLSFQEKRGDLRKFFEMDNPLDAAKALRQHLQKYSISLESTELSQKGTETAAEQKEAAAENGRLAVHVFNGEEFVPERGVEAGLADHTNRLKVETQGERIVCILQTQGEITMKDVLELLEANVKIYEPVGRQALIVRLPLASISLLQARPYVRWIGEYKPEYKYATIPPPQSGNPSAYIYTLGGDRPDYRADLAHLGVTVRGYDVSALFYEVVLDSSRFKELAENLWWVKGIEKEPEQTLHALNYEPDDSRELIGAFSTSFSGAGTRIGVYDTGLWPSNSLDFPSGSFTSLNGWGDSQGHGTHVSGIIAARGGRDIEGSNDAKGVAPGAKVYMVSGVGGSGGGYSYSTAFQYFVDNQVQVSNHSWGFTDNFSYDNNTTAIDGYADNRDMTIVFSAGNDYNSRTIGNPGTGKNVITVGALTYVTAGGAEIGRRASYSSQGPTADDARLKPDLVAPGGDDTYQSGVVSTISDPWSMAGTTGNINGVYKFPEWPSNDYYGRISGTSQAAPHVTGVCAKMKEWKPDFHSELFKALLINTTIPIKANSSDALAGYANTQVGYGLVNALSVTSVYPGESERLLFGEGYVTEDSRMQNWQIAVPSGAKKLIVTLAYNDEEGESSNSAAIKDDLDLYLISPGGVEYVAYQHKATGVVGESPLEKMVIQNPSSGTWTLRVNFYNSPGFGNLFVFAEQVYGVVAHAIYKTPALSLSVPQATINVTPGQNFNIQPTITNTGGYIADGVTVQIDGSSALGGNINQSMYVGNLPYQNAAASPSINLVAPSSAGTYTLTVKADGINKDFDNSSYPKTAQVTINVQQPAIPTLTSSLVISPAGPYTVGQTITGTFSITNRGTSAVTFDVLTIGGRLNDDVTIRDFPWHTNVTLNPSETKTYQDSFPLSEAGSYRFFPAFRIAGIWKIGLLHEIPKDPNVVDLVSFSVAGVSLLSPPVLVAPGTSTAPGSSIATLTPTFNWQSVTGADGYALYVSRYNGSSYDLIFDSQVDVGQPLIGNSYVLPAGRLQDGGQYRWNMSSHNSAGYGTPNTARYYFYVSLPAQTYTISVSASPAGAGTVTGNGTFAAGSSRTVTATANTNYTFTNWTENGGVVSSSISYTFTLNNNRTLVANFTTINYTITVGASPSGGGTVSGGGTFAAGSSRTVTATANTNYTFTNWTENGSVVSSSASYTFPLNSNRNLVANFTPTQVNYTITVSASPSAGGTVSGGGIFAAGSSRTVMATANTNYTFTNWTENGSVVSSSASYAFTLNNNRNLVANFTSTGAPSTNFALTANGGLASASSTTPNSQFPGYNFLPSVTNDGNRKSGVNFWRDDTANVYPDWLQVDFNGTKTITEIDVFTLQDNDQNPSDPTQAMTFTLNGITAFDVQYWTGSAWVTVPNGSVTGNNKVWRQFTFSPIATSKVRVLINNALNSRSRIVELEAWGTAASGSANQALAANGGLASASSTTPNSQFPGYNFLPSVTNDGNRKSGVNFWRDDTANVYPDWLQVDFNGTKTITEIDVFTLQDNDQNPSDPTQAMTFTLNGITAFEVQYWTGSAWVTVPNGSVTGNNKVWRQLTFSPIATNKVRVLVNNALNSRSRIVELEAWGTAVSNSANQALAANGGFASASSTTPNSQFPGYNFLPSVTNDGDRKSGVNFWRDDTANAYPDWLQVDFNGSKTITEIDVFTLQDNDQAPVEPTQAMTFSVNGITAFDVQYWTGSGWITVPNGSVTGNNKVWRQFTFSPIATSKVRVLVNNALNGRSRIVELEAY